MGLVSDLTGGVESVAPIDRDRPELPVPGKPGAYKTENTITVTEPYLNEGRPTVIPTIIDGQQRTPQEAILHAVKTGENFGVFDSIEEADTYARARSAEIDRVRHPTGPLGQGLRDAGLEAADNESGRIGFLGSLAQGVREQRESVRQSFVTTRRLALGVPVDIEAGPKISSRSLAIRDPELAERGITRLLTREGLGDFMGQMITGSTPFITATMLGGMVAGFPGAIVGGGLAAGAQALGDMYLGLRRRGMDHKSSVDKAVDAGLWSAGLNAASIPVAALAPFKGLVSNALFQAWTQGTLGGMDQVTQNLVAGRPIFEGVPDAVVGEIMFEAPGLVGAVRGTVGQIGKAKADTAASVETPPPGSPGTPVDTSGIEGASAEAEQARRQREGVAKPEPPPEAPPAETESDVATGEEPFPDDKENAQDRADLDTAIQEAEEEARKDAETEVTPPEQTEPETTPGTPPEPVATEEAPTPVSTSEEAVGTEGPLPEGRTGWVRRPERMSDEQAERAGVDRDQLERMEQGAVDRIEVDGEPLETNRPFEMDLYNGYGRGTEAELYSEGVGPIFGRGMYLSLRADRAESYGPRVRRVRLRSRRPYVAVNFFDFIVKAAQSEAGASAVERAAERFGEATRWTEALPVSAQDEAARMMHLHEILQEAAKNLRAEGYDSIYVEVPFTQDTNRQGAPVKRWAEVFDETQVFVLDDSAIAGVEEYSDVAQPPIGEPEAEVTLERAPEIKPPIGKRRRGRPRKHPRPEVVKAIKEGRQRIAKMRRRIEILSNKTSETIVKTLRELGGLNLNDIKAQYNWKEDFVETGLSKIPGLFRRGDRGLSLGKAAEVLVERGELPPGSGSNELVEALKSRELSAAGAAEAGERDAEIQGLNEQANFEEIYLERIEELAQRNPELTMEELEALYAEEHDRPNVPFLVPAMGLTLERATAAELYVTQDSPGAASDLPEPPPPPEKFRVPRKRQPEEGEPKPKKPKWPKQRPPRWDGRVDATQYWLDRAADWIRHTHGKSREMWSEITQGWFRPMIERVEGAPVHKAGPESGDFRRALAPTRPLVGRTIAKMARRVIDRAALYYGKWSPAFVAYLSLIDGKGKDGLAKRRAYAELNERQLHGRFWNNTQGLYSVNRFFDAIENDEAFDTLSPRAQEAVRRARGLVRMTGLDAEALGVEIMDRGERAKFRASRKGDRAIRMFTHHLYNIIRNPVANAQAFAALIDAVADINFVEPPEAVGKTGPEADALRAAAWVEQKLMWARILRKRTPRHRHQVYGKVRERTEAFEYAREIPNFPTELKVGDTWVKLVDDDPFTWATRLQRHAAARLGFISVFGQFRHDVDAIADTYEAAGGRRQHMVDLLNALQLKPVDRPSPHAVDSWAYKGRELMDQALGAYRALLLSGAFVPNLVEGPAKIPAVFGGRRYARELANLIARGGFDPIALSETERIAGRTVDVVNFNFDRKNIPYSLSKLFRQAMLYPTTKANEMTEFLAAATGLLMAEDLRAGRGTRLDAYRLRHLLKFTDSQVAALMAGTAAQDLYEAVVRRGVMWSQNTISQPAEKSRLNASRWWNRFIIADTYAQMTAARTADVVHAWWLTLLEQAPLLLGDVEGATAAERKANRWKNTMKAMDELYVSSRIMAEYFGGAAVAGTLSMLLASLVFRGPEDVKQTIEDWKRNPATWAGDAIMYSLMGGAMAMLAHGLSKGSPTASLLDFGQNLLPVRALTEMYDSNLMGTTPGGARGVYRGMDLGERAEQFLKRNLMIDRFFRVWAPAVIVGNRDPKFEAARRRYWEWMRKNVGIDTVVQGMAEDLETLEANRADQAAFIGLMRRATEAVRRGDKPSAFWKPLQEAVEMRGESSVAASLYGRRMLTRVPAQAWEKFVEDIGPDNLAALKRYDYALKNLAEALGEQKRGRQ